PASIIEFDSDKMCHKRYYRAEPVTEPPQPMQPKKPRQLQQQTQLLPQSPAASNVAAAQIECGELQQMQQMQHVQPILQHHNDHYQFQAEPTVKDWCNVQRHQLRMQQLHQGQRLQPHSSA
ncbi:hypothetical protein PFISCL1PPCAC_8487, partial [Pristionchus fissidentatus]